MIRSSLIKIGIIVFLFCLLGNRLDAQTVSDWENLKMDYATYLKNPSVENVNKVCAAITGIEEKHKIATPQPENKKSPNEVSWYASPTDKAAGKTVDYIMNHINPLEERMKRGDKPSIQMAFRLLFVSDFAFAEDLNELLNSLIHQKPELYLEGLWENRKKIEKTVGLDHLISFMGMQFADQAGQPEKEYRLRINDLQKVKTPNLIPIRNECIKILKNEISKAG